jgi:hypothetical protein
MLIIQLSKHSPLPHSSDLPHFSKFFIELFDFLLQQRQCLCPDPIPLLILLQNVQMR